MFIEWWLAAHTHHAGWWRCDPKPPREWTHKALVARLKAPGDLYVVSPDDSLAGLRIIEDGIFLIDVVLCRKIAGVGCSPMLIQCLTYFLISHTTVLISVPVAFADPIPTRGYAALNHHLQFQQRRAE